MIAPNRIRRVNHSPPDFFFFLFSSRIRTINDTQQDMLIFWSISIISIPPIHKQSFYYVMFLEWNIKIFSSCKTKKSFTKVVFIWMLLAHFQYPNTDPMKISKSRLKIEIISVSNCIHIVSQVFEPIWSNS